MKNVYLGAAIFIAATAACVGHIMARTERRATEEVCQLIRDNYFRPDQADVQSFLKHCETDLVPFTFTRAKAIKHINSKLSQIHSSHLSLYSPDENRWLWDNEGSDTGLRARMIDGEVVVIGTLEQSPARRARLRAGDVVVSINGEPPSNVQDAQTTQGFYKIARGQQFFQTDLKLEDLKEDLGPKLIEVSKSTAVLKIPSFLPMYFEQEGWLQMARKFESDSRLVIDLRGNPGGSFPAMLRALSPFRCGINSIGRIWRAPRPQSQAPVDMQDDLSADAQLEQITASDEIDLKTFGDSYGCFKGETIVLVDSNTSSVSEIFAHAMLKQGRVWGNLTAGQVVMARWFSIASLGGGDYAMSIPIAGFRASDGAEIERDGVQPDRDLHYDLATALRGEDSWIQDALKAF